MNILSSFNHPVAIITLRNASLWNGELPQIDVRFVIPVPIRCPIHADHEFIELVDAKLSSSSYRKLTTFLFDPIHTDDPMIQKIFARLLSLNIVLKQIRMRIYDHCSASSMNSFTKQTRTFKKKKDLAVIAKII